MLSAEIVLSPSVILLKLLHTTFCHFALFKFLNAQSKIFNVQIRKLYFLNEDHLHKVLSQHTSL